MNNFIALCVVPGILHPNPELEHLIVEILKNTATKKYTWSISEDLTVQS